MNAAENEAEPRLTAELLADLQAGLLDDHTAARVRDRVRSDPQAAAALRSLHQVRGDVAALGTVPETAPGAAHAARPPMRPTRTVAAVVGLCAVVAAIAVGTAALLDEPAPAPSTPATAQHITVSTPAASIPLSQPDILDLLTRAPDFGPLANVALRSSCLSGLGYPAATQILGARPIEINTRLGVLLVLPGDSPDYLTVYAVTLNCNAADTGLLATTTVTR